MLSRIITLIGLGIVVGGYSQAQEIPTIIAQPGDTAVVLYGGVSQTLSQPVPIDATIFFDAGAKGDGLIYQWTLNGDPISGATNSTLTISNVSVLNGGSYAVSVYNDWGTVASQRAVVRTECPDLALYDNFADAAVITSTAGIGRGDYWAATREEGEPEHAGVTGIQSKWLTWVAPSNGVATIQTFGSSFDTVLAVYTGESVSNLTEVASDNDPLDHQGCSVMFNAQAGVAYRIAAGGYMNSGIENLVLAWQLIPVAYPLPAIYQQPQSQTSDEGQSVTLSIIYTNEGPMTVQWYFEGQAISNANQDTLELMNLTEDDLGVYSVALISSEWTYFLKPIEIQFNTEGAVGAAARHKLNASSNSPLGDNGDTGDGETLLSGDSQFFSESNSMETVQPMGLIVPPVTGYSGTQLFKTYPGKDPDEPNICGIVGGASYWFSYAPPENGTFFVNTTGSTFDTLLGVFIDNGSNQGYASLVQVACNDNSSGVTSALSVRVTKGVTYYIMIDGKRGATGTVSLHYLLDRMPTISSIATQAINEEQSTAPISFTIGDFETAAGSLQVSGMSTNQSLVASNSIVFSGTGANRTVTITPTPYSYGTNTITIYVKDASGNTSSRSFVLQVRKINHPPIAVADSYTRLTNSSITIAIAAFLRNDSDIDGNAITMTAVSGSQSGYASVTKGFSSVTYTPIAGFNANDRFTYTLSDGNGGTATGTVNILVGTNGQTNVY